jgi:GTP-binding protein EngB required for normal cell division
MSNQMQTELQRAHDLIRWYRSSVRPFLARLQPEKIAEFDSDCGRLRNRVELMDRKLAVCFLGNSCVGKSTLIICRG